jgi:uncharacterized glyoxalase superfamily protein PhnB
MSDTESRLVAILKSADVPRTIEWYGAAGFEIRGYVPESDPTWCEVGRDGTILQFLAGTTPWEGTPAFTGCLYVHTADVDGVYEELRERVTCEYGVEERDWGARELVLQDPDGYYVTFTQR